MKIELSTRYIRSQHGLHGFGIVKHATAIDLTFVGMSEAVLRAFSYQNGRWSEYRFDGRDWLPQRR